MNLFGLPARTLSLVLALVPTSEVPAASGAPEPARWSWQARTLILYLNGHKDAAAHGVNASVSLANDGDLHVGGTPNGRHLNGALDFLRVAHGTLADADTAIEELYAWQFDGPFLRDFAGRRPVDGRRTVGAIAAQ